MERNLLRFFEISKPPYPPKDFPSPTLCLHKEKGVRSYGPNPSLAFPHSSCPNLPLLQRFTLGLPAPPPLYTPTPDERVLPRPFLEGLGNENEKDLHQEALEESFRLFVLKEESGENQVCAFPLLSSMPNPPNLLPFFPPGPFKNSFLAPRRARYRPKIKRSSLK
jgi:hypothetical protein